MKIQIETLSKSKWTLLSCLSITVLTFTVYSGSLLNEFQLNWDDQIIVMNHYTENGLNVENLLQIFTEFYRGQYAPINQLFYTAIFSLVGYSALYFHLFSLLVHVLTSILVYFTMRKLLRDANMSELSVLRIAFITSLLFSIHPFMVESVAWVSASKVVLYGFFYWLSVLSYLHFKQSQNHLYYIITFIAFIIAFGSKEQAVTLPLCLLLIDYNRGDIIKREVWLEKLPFFILVAVFGIITLNSQFVDGLGVLSESNQYPFHQRIIFATYSISEYFVKCLVPVNLMHVYPFPNKIGATVPIWMWIYPILISVIGILAYKNITNKWLFFGIVFFVIHLLPVLNLVSLSRFSIIADRYCYVASVGVFFCLAYIFDSYASITNRSKLSIAFLIIYFISLFSYSISRTTVWQNSETLKRDITKQINKRNLSN